MLERKKPILTAGRILRNEMIESLRDFPRQIVDIYLAPYTDGVICGLDLNVTDTEITIAPGLVKYQNELLISEEQITTPYVADGNEQILKIKFEAAYDIYNESGQVVRNFEGRNAEVVLNGEEYNRQNELELARFRLSQGAFLRSDYQDFSDFKTGHNTLNIVNQPYASLSGATLNPAILKYFARELLTYKTENPHDVNIIFGVLNAEVSINRELLVAYIRMRLNDEQISLSSNINLHNGLSQVLQKAKSEQRSGSRKIIGRSALIVD